MFKKKAVGSIVIAVGLVLFSFTAPIKAEEKTPPTKKELIEVEKLLKELREITEKMEQTQTLIDEKLGKELKKIRQQFQGKVKCLDNLREISRALLMYSLDHDEKFPESLSDLCPKYLTESDMLRCPAKNVPYCYVKGLTATISPDDAKNIIIVYDASIENHGDVRYVISALGYIKRCKEEEFQKLLQKTKDFLKSQVHGK